MKGFKQRRAFTIVEMVIVIAVIAVLATVMIPTVSGVIDRANVSNDQQFVMTLNKQLAVWEANNEKKITTEKDLRAAFAAFYEADFYNKLEPKSAKQGYNYWFVPESRQVIFAKYEDLPGELARYNLLSTEMKEWVTLLAAGMSDAGRGGTDPYGFERNSLRSLVSSNNINVFLLDKGGSDFAKKLIDLENSQNDADYQEKQVNLKAAEAESGLLNAVTKKMANTAVANENGVFFRSSESEIKFVHVPQGVTSIGAYQVKQENVTSDVKEIHLPDTVEELGTDSLTEITNDDTFIYWDKQQTPDQLKDTVGENAFKGNLQLSNGETWRFEVSAEGKNNVLTNGTVTVETQPKYKSELNTFELSVAEKNEKYDLHSYMDGTRTLHYTSDFNGSVVLQVANLVDENGMPVDRTPEWKLGNEVIAAKKFTLTKAQLDANSQITVTIQNLSATIDVVKVSIDDQLTTSVSGVSGNPEKGEDGYAYYNATLEYRQGSSWTVSGAAVLTPNVTCVAMSNDVTLSLSGADASKLTLNGNTISVNSGVKGDLNATLTITSEGTNADGKHIGVKYNLTFKQASATFAIADNADTQTKYGIKFTVGTVQPIKLGDLFKVVQGTPENIVVTWSNNGSAPTPFSYTSQSGNWTEWEITPSTAGDNFAISITDGGATCTLPVKVVSGVYNVATSDQWLAVPNRTGFAIIKPVTLNNSSKTTVSPTTALESSENCTGADYYSKKLSTQTIYGNYNKISVPSFLMKLKNSNNYFIYCGGGTLQNVVLEGPEYSSCADARSNGGNGYYVAGVEATGGSKIIDSYLAGFRSPLRCDSGTITVQNSVLRGGVFANIYVRDVENLVLENTSLVQYKNSSNLIGVGIYCDLLTTGGAADSAFITLKGNTQFYDWLNNSENYSTKIGYIKNALFDGVEAGCGSSTGAINYVHTMGGTEYINACIATESSSEADAHSQLKIQYDSTYTGPQFCAKDEVVTKKVTLGNTYRAYSIKTCSSCSHQIYLDNNSSYNADAFIASKLK